MACLHSYKKLGFPSYHMNVRQWWKSLQAKKKIYAEFNWDDPIVTLYILYGIMAQVRRRLVR